MDVLSESTNAIGKLGTLADQVKVQLEAVRDVRSLHLERHLLAIFQRRAVHLPERCRVDGDGVICGEDVLQRLAELRLHRLERVGVAEGGKRVLKGGELVEILRREEVRARGERLSHLDERGAELGEFLRELGRAHLGV